MLQFNTYLDALEFSHLLTAPHSVIVRGEHVTYQYRFSERSIAEIMFPLGIIYMSTFASRYNGRRTDLH